MLHTVILLVVLWCVARLVVRVLATITAAVARAIGLAGDPEQHTQGWSALLRTLIALGCLSFAIPLCKLLWDAGVLSPFAQLPGVVVKLVATLWVALWQAAFGGT